MSRRRTAKGDGSGDAAPAKKSRLDNQIDGKDVQWEWEADGHTWTQYTDDLNNAITQAYLSKQKELKFDVGKATLIVVFDKMVQKNKATGWERRLRFCIKDSTDGDFYIWHWEDEKGAWNPYSIQGCLDLENSYLGDSKTVEIEACHRSYQIDVGKMEQVNTVTNVTRKIVRDKSKSVKPVDHGTVTIASTGAASSSKSVTKRGKSAAVKVKDEPEDEEEEDVKPATKSRGKAAKSGGKGGRSGAENGDEGPKVKTLVLKGKAPVDPECSTMLGKSHVFYEGKDVWDCMLNQTNVANNNNKYYLIQLLQEDAKKAFHVWQRWGRVGYTGQNNLVPCGADIDKAKQIFCKKFADKTKNDWSQRNKFVKVPGKYHLLEMDYSGKDTVDAASVDDDDVDKKDVKVPDSKLDKRLQDYINLICDVKSMEDAVIEMKYDAKKAPLGKLTEESVKAGYAALKKIDTCINKNDFGRNLTQACDEFYTRIPHDFGMRVPPVIRTKEEVERKMQLLEALGDIEIALKTLKKGDRSENPVDRHYHALKCELKPVEQKSDVFKIVNDYLQNTHASTHNQYKMQILDIFEVEKQGEAAKFKDHGNRQLLWHGSRLTNWVGILSQGLKIAPPEAPVTGYMFGKGVYFADMSSKSANYCFATRSKTIGTILLCEVSLGTTNDLLNADYAADKLPPGKHSVRGLGMIGPDPSKTATLPCGTVVPLGKSKNTGVNNPTGYTLNYNEYIVYNTDQIKMRYLIKVKFNFK